MTVARRPRGAEDREFEQIVARVERRERLERRVHLLGISWLVLSALGVVAAALLFLAVAPWGLVFGDPAAVGFFAVVGAILGGSLLALSIPGAVLGLGLLRRRPWARTLAIVLGALALLQVPLGTVLGGLTLAVLLGDEVGRVFEPGVRGA